MKIDSARKRFPTFGFYACPPEMDHEFADDTWNRFTDFGEFAFPDYTHWGDAVR